MNYLGRAVFVPAIVVFVVRLLASLISVMGVNVPISLAFLAFLSTRSSLFLFIVLAVTFTVVVMSFLRARKNNLPRHFPSQEFFKMTLWVFFADVVGKILNLVIQGILAVDSGGYSSSAATSELLAVAPFLIISEFLFIIPFITFTYLFGYFVTFILKRAS